MSRLEDVIRRGTRAAQPAASLVATGTLYFVTGENVLERSNGTSWENCSSGGSGSLGSLIASGVLFSVDGEDGFDGLPGKAGIAGVIGATGAAGLSGLIGPPGIDGEDGEPILIPGLVGPVGPAGAAGGGGSWTLVHKPTDESRTSTTTRTADAALLVALAANTKYIIRGFLFVNSLGGGGFFGKFNGPASPTFISTYRVGIDGTATSLSTNIVKHDTAYNIDFSTGADTVIDFQIIIHNGSNTGNFTIDWAQASGNSNATILKAGSYLEYKSF